MNGIQKQDFLILIRLPVIKNIGSDVLTLNKTKSISYSSKIQPFFVYNLQLCIFSLITMIFTIKRGLFARKE